MIKAERQDLEDALKSMASMIDRTEKAKEKFVQGSAQHTLLTNRLHALNTAAGLISNELVGGAGVHYATAELERASSPIASLISKSEKAQNKLRAGTWQHTMLAENLKALYIASTYLERALSHAMNTVESENSLSRSN